MSHNTPKRQLSSASSPTKHDKTNGKVFITPNRYASLSVEHLPEVFSPPPVAESSLHQGLDTSTSATIHTKSNRSPPIYIKNLTNLSKLRNALSPILGPE
ncbi:PRE C2HC domain-containing protein, partial [Aphis craccivora]